VSATPLHVVVLAAGKGTRMKARRPKVLHPMAGLPIIGHVLRTAAALHPASVLLIVGHQADEVQRALAGSPGLRFAIQEPQLGTGHAVLAAEPFVEGRTGTLVLLYGDVPLLRPATVERLVDHHRATGAAATVLTAVLDDPFGYGRIIREDGRLVRIVEERDADAHERQVREINSGIYAFDLPPLFDALRGLAASNTQGEYYLTDLVATYRQRGLPLETVLVDDPVEVRGINSQSELADLTAHLRAARCRDLMAEGVTLLDPTTTYVDVDVRVGPDTVVHPDVHLEGHTRIGAGCEVHAGTRIVDSSVDDGAVIRNHCVIQQSRIAGGAVVGPFAHIRPDSDVCEGAHVGNFVELKKTVLGAGSKANHLAYLGDATIGADVNIGAGTITCNYDGTRKHQTTIEDGVFIGSDSQLVAPVTIGRGAYVAAGSSIVEDVPAGALGIARGRQVNKAGWVEATKARKGAGRRS
jgi:bifunctional UDP-N-acetylglucosamine pyrophosphorylase/glucosamine-1-phosphate N-acetyltransferase